MGLFHSPNIVTDGLILNLDAGNTKSYPGSGTTWTDLSKENNHATLSNFTVGSLNGGTLTANGATSSGFINASASLQPASITMEVMIKPLNSGGSFSSVISYPPNDDAHQSPFMIYAIYLTHAAWSNVGRVHTRISGSAHYSPENTYEFGVWNHLVVSFHNQALKFYRDGVLKGTNTESAATISYSGYENQNVMIGVNPNGTEDFEGEYSNVKLYNRALTDEEVSQNFDAIRGRFGL